MCCRRLCARAGGTASGSALSSLSLIESTTLEFPTGLDTEISKVARAFAMGADEFAPRTTLRSKGCGGLEALFFAVLDKFFLLMNGAEDRLRVKRGAGAGRLNCRL